MPTFTICQKIGGYKRCFCLSVRRKTNNRLTLFRKCFICGKDIVTTADTPFIRQIANVNGKKQATVYFCSESCKRKSYKHLFDGNADKRRKEGYLLISSGLQNHAIQCSTFADGVIKNPMKTERTLTFSNHLK